MTPPPTEGPLHPRWGPYVRNVQKLTDTLYLADACRGTKGLGKVWYPSLLTPNPRAGQPSWTNGPPHGAWQESGYVKPATGYRANQHTALLFDSPRCVEAVLSGEAEAIAFMIYAAKEFFK